MIRRVMPKPGSKMIGGRIPRLGLCVLAGLLATIGSSPAVASKDAPASALPGAIPTLRDKPIKAGPTRWDRELQRRKDLLGRNRGRKPAAVLGVLGLLADLHGEIEPSKLEGFTRSVAEDRSRHPLVRSYASYVLARLRESAGDHKSAKQGMLAEGYLISWQIVGPFDNTNRRGEMAVYAPQTEAYQAEQTFTGKLATEPLGWRPRDYDSIPRGAYVSFDDLLRPNTEVTGYATCWVKVDKDTPAALHMGSGGPYQAWIDGVEVGSNSAYRVSHPLQDSHAIALRKGWNRLLVKVSALDRMWGFHARLSLPSGAPIEGLQAQANVPRDWTEAAEDSVRPKPPKSIASLRDALQKAYPQRDGARPGPGRAGLDLVAFYRYVRPFDFDEANADELARSVDERLETAESAWLRAILERDAGESMRSLRRGVKRARAARPAAGSVAVSLQQMLLELGWRERSLGLEDDYRARVAEAYELAPQDAVVELQLVDDLAEQGYAWASLAWLRDLVRRNPHSESLRAELASRLRRQGRPQEALESLEALANDRGSSTAVVAERIETLLDLGRADDAVELARRSADASPGLPRGHLQVGRLEEGRRRYGAAKAAWAKALALAPHDAGLHAQFGRLLARIGETSAAASSLKRSLALRPQQPDVRDLLASLDTGSASDMFERFGVDFAEIAETKAPKAWAGKDAGLLRHRVAVKVLPNGLTERLDHRIIRILDDRGIRNQAMQVLSFDPAESIVEVRRARVRRANGTIEEIGDVQMVALASAGYRMYYDQRQIRVVFPGLRVGDTLEVAFLQRDVAASNMFEDYFGDLMPVQGIEPRLKVEYILEAPKDKPIFFNRPGVKRKTRGDSVLYRYSAENVLAIKPEGGMPGWTEIADYLHASTYETWDDVGKWYWDLVREQLVVDDDIRAAVAEATRGLPTTATEADKVAAIYEYVVRNTRYVGLEFGIHGYKPYRTTEILDRQFGDCKDKASLLKVMLAEVGSRFPSGARSNARPGNGARQAGIAVGVQPRDHLRTQPRPVSRRDRRVVGSHRAALAGPGGQCPGDRRRPRGDVSQDPDVQGCRQPTPHAAGHLAVAPAVRPPFNTRSKSAARRPPRFGTAFNPRNVARNASPRRSGICTPA